MNHPLCIEDGHLRIRPLGSIELTLFLFEKPSFEAALGLVRKTRDVDDAMRARIQSRVLPAMHDPAENAYLHTVWAIVDVTLGLMVGEVCFKGRPNELGEVEIGYRTFTEFRNQGYMTAAVTLISDWALSQEGIRAVRAMIASDNEASAAVLRKAGFALVDDYGEDQSWRRLRTTADPLERTGLPQPYATRARVSRQAPRKEHIGSLPQR